MRDIELEREPDTLSFLRRIYDPFRELHVALPKFDNISTGDSLSKEHNDNISKYMHTKIRFSMIQSICEYRGLLSDARKIFYRTTRGFHRAEEVPTSEVLRLANTAVQGRSVDLSESQTSSSSKFFSFSRGKYLVSTLMF